MEKHLCFNSPVGSEKLMYSWPLNKGINIQATLTFAGEEYPEIDQELQIIMSEVDWKCYESMSLLSGKFNNLVSKFSRKGADKSKLLQKPATRLLEHILVQSQWKAVTDVKILKTLRGTQTYGETLFNTTSEIIKKLEIKEDDTFLDLGSGIGNVILQIAGSVKCKLSMGIECTGITSQYARNMDTEFQKLLNWFGKSTSPYALIKGDFLCFKELINSATIIFVNNFVFDPKVNCELGNLLLNLKDGTKIVSTLRFSRDQIVVNERNSNSLESILRSDKNKRVIGSVSWSPNHVVYYIDVIDRTSLNTYLANNLQQEKKKGNHRRTQEILPIEESKSSENEKNEFPRLNVVESPGTQILNVVNNTQEVLSVGHPICIECTTNKQLLDIANSEQEKANNNLKAMATQCTQTTEQFNQLVLDLEALENKLTLKENEVKNLRAQLDQRNVKENQEQIALLPEKCSDGAPNDSNSAHNNLQSNLSDLPPSSTRNLHVSRKKNKLTKRINSKNKKVHGTDATQARVCVCTKPFDSVAKLHKHINYFNNPKKFICEHCGKRFSGRSHLRKHLKNTHKEKLEKLITYACRHCLEELPSQVDLKRHHRLFHMEENKSSLNKDSRAIKHKVKQTKKGHRCTCGKSFKSLHRVRSHVSYFNCKTKLVTCVFCNKEFEDNIKLEIHLKSRKHRIR